MFRKGLGDFLYKTRSNVLYHAEPKLNLTITHYYDYITKNLPSLAGDLIMVDPEVVELKRFKASVPYGVAGGIGLFLDVIGILVLFLPKMKAPSEWVPVGIMLIGIILMLGGLMCYTLVRAGGFGSGSFTEEGS